MSPVTSSSTGTVAGSTQSMHKLYAELVEHGSGARVPTVHSPMRALVSAPRRRLRGSAGSAGRERAAATAPRELRVRCAPFVGGSDGGPRFSLVDFAVWRAASRGCRQG